MQAGRRDDAFRQSFVPLMLDEVKGVCDAGWQFLLIMGYHHHRLVFAAAESLYDGSHQQASWFVQPMQRFVQDKQFGVFHKGTCQEAKPLLAAA